MPPRFWRNMSESSLNGTISPLGEMGPAEIKPPRRPSWTTKLGKALSAFEQPVKIAIKIKNEYAVFAEIIFRSPHAPLGKTSITRFIIFAIGRGSEVYYSRD